MTSADVLKWLRRRSSRKNVEGMARYGITTDTNKVFGVSMGTMKVLQKKLGKNHALAQELWATGWYEARILAALIDDPAKVTRRQMDAWTRAFDNWAICDTACFHLFDKTPHAWAAVDRWAASKKEFVKRAAFALTASLAVHDKKAPDELFLAVLPLIERAADDERNFVKKGVSWALRGIGNRNAKMHAQAIRLAKKLAASPDAARRWVGKDVLRDLSRPLVKARLERRARVSGD
jgi:3-methyladenine DNA glycosylase AlkD